MLGVGGEVLDDDGGAERVDDALVVGVEEDTARDGAVETDHTFELDGLGLILLGSSGGGGHGDGEEQAGL